MEVSTPRDFYFLLLMTVPMYLALAVLAWKLSPTGVGLVKPDGGEPHLRGARVAVCVPGLADLPGEQGDAQEWRCRGDVSLQVQAGGYP